MTMLFHFPGLTLVAVLTTGQAFAQIPADRVILGNNPLVVDSGSIKDIPVLETIARGKTIFSR